MLLDSGYFLPDELVGPGHIRHGDMAISYEEVEPHAKIGPMRLRRDRALMFFSRAKLIVDGVERLVRPGELVLLPHSVTYTIECVDKQPTSLLSFS